MLSADHLGIKRVRLPSGKQLVEKSRKLVVTVTAYNESDVLHYFGTKDAFPFRSDDFQVHLEGRIGVLRVPENTLIPVGLHWVRFMQVFQSSNRAS